MQLTAVLSSAAPRERERAVREVVPGAPLASDDTPARLLGGEGGGLLSSHSLACCQHPITTGEEEARKGGSLAQHAAALPSYPSSCSVAIISMAYKYTRCVVTLRRQRRIRTYSIAPHSSVIINQSRVQHTSRARLDVTKNALLLAWRARGGLGGPYIHEEPSLTACCTLLAD